MVRIEQSDWLRSLSERAGVSHPAHFETQPARSAKAGVK